MTIFVFDNLSESGYKANLSYIDGVASKVNFIEYMKLEGVPYTLATINDITEDTNNAIYPIQLDQYHTTNYFLDVPDVVFEAARNDRLKIVFFQTEGDDPTEHIIDQIFSWYEFFDLPIGSIRWVTGNWKLRDTDPFIYFCDYELYTKHKLADDYVHTVNMHERSKTFTCWNRVDRPFRRIFAASLHQQGVHHRGYLTYQNVKSTRQTADELNSKIIDWDEYFENNIVLLEQFKFQLPIKYQQDDYINYVDSYWNFVTESHFEADTTFLTEKTFKSVLNLQPFVIIGGANSIELMQELGYRTFDGYIHEDYDDSDSDEARMFDLMTVAMELCALSKDELTEQMAQMRPILEHNQRNLLSCKRERLLDVLDEVDA